MKGGATIVSALYVVVVALTAPASGGCGQQEGQIESYEESVRTFREARDRALASEGSPIPAEFRAGFDGLRYYSPDSAYRLEARFVAAPENADSLLIRSILDSRGSTRSMRELGHLIFRLPSASSDDTLWVLEPIEGPDSAPFVAFSDPTNEEATYRGGRYLEVEIPGKGKGFTSLDFNYAYNPYCAYNEEYSCPLVYERNHLSRPVHAGERRPRLPK